MDKLIQLLEDFENNSDIPSDEDSFILDTDIEAAASNVLIGEDGSCNWDNIDILRKNGFGVIPVEQDSFGWLIGGILTKKGIITYG